jgi:predicted short-subunit dehydrogenase-like oxidoreductase (DUF2520 family)
MAQQPRLALPGRIQRGDSAILRKQREQLRHIADEFELAVTLRREICYKRRKRPLVRNYLIKTDARPPLDNPADQV